MEYFKILLCISESRNGSDRREMKYRLAGQSDIFATNVSKISGCPSDLKTCDQRERVLKRKINSRYAGFIESAVTAPQGKVCTKGTRMSLRISGNPCDYLALEKTEKK